MENVVYIGSSDIRELGEEDFKKMGTKHKAVRFHKGQPVEVSNECAEALLGHELVAGQFLAFQVAEKEGKTENIEGGTSNLMVNADDDSGDEQADAPGQEDAQTDSAGDAASDAGTASTGSTASKASGTTAKASKGKGKTAG